MQDMFTRYDWEDDDEEGPRSRRKWREPPKSRNNNDFFRTPQPVWGPSSLHKAEWMNEKALIVDHNPKTIYLYLATTIMTAMDTTDARSTVNLSLIEQNRAKIAQAMKEAAHRTATQQQSPSSLRPKKQRRAPKQPCCATDPLGSSSTHDYHKKMFHSHWVYCLFNKENMKKTFCFLWLFGKCWQTSCF